MCIRDRGAQFVVGKVLVVHGHQLQSLQPVDKVGRGAAGVLRPQAQQPVAQPCGLRQLMFQHVDLLVDHARQRHVRPCQEISDVRQRQAQAA